MGINSSLSNDPFSRSIKGRKQEIQLYDPFLSCLCFAFLGWQIWPQSRAGVKSMVLG